MEDFERKYPNPNDDDKGDLKHLIYFAMLLILLGFSVGLYGYGAKGKWPELANLGSFLQGTTAAIWSLAGVLLIYAAFVVQHRQFRYQQQELEITRADLKEQREVTMLQNFESRFFQLLNLHNQNVAQLRQPTMLGSNSNVVAMAHTLEGRACFQKWYSNLLFAFPKVMWLGIGDAEARKIIQTGYSKFYDSHQGDLGHYFRTLYHVFKFVENSHLSPKQKRTYASLVRAQLSAYELALLFYDGLAFPPEEANKFKALIENFGLLEHLNSKFLFDASHKKLYSEGAYK